MRRLPLAAARKAAKARWNGYSPPTRPADCNAARSTDTSATRSSPEHTDPIPNLG